MTLKNFYPELPIVPYQKTSVLMPDVIKYLQSLQAETEVKRATYIIFRNESLNGLKGVNNNFIGFQSDSGRWQTEYDKYLVGVCIKVENKTQKQRGFLCFSHWQDSIDILSDKLKDRGIYVGGTTHLITQVKILTKEQLAVAYQREWVRGDETYTPLKTEVDSFLSMYSQAERLFI